MPQPPRRSRPLPLRQTPTEREPEVPLDHHNHALAALRYLIARLDFHRMAKAPADPQAETQSPAQQPARRREQTLREWIEDDRNWIPLNW